jgi:phosphoribosylglycinamide formyltransferase 2
MVTLISQDLSEFALHARAILGLPIGSILQYAPSASSVILPSGTSSDIRFDNLTAALSVPESQLRLFGKPEINGQRRLGVALSRGKTLEQALERAKAASGKVEVIF